VVSLVSRQQNSSGIDEAVIFQREYRLVEKSWRLVSEAAERCPEQGLCWPPAGETQRPVEGAEEVLLASAELEQVVAAGDEAALDQLLARRCESTESTESTESIYSSYERDKWIDRDEVKSALKEGRVTELARDVEIDGQRATVRSLVDLAGETDPKQPRTWGIVSHRELVRTDSGWRLCRVRWETATCAFLAVRGPWAALGELPYRETSVNPCWPPVWEDPTRPGCTRHYYHR
jgi:hypothetical protein